MQDNYQGKYDRKLVNVLCTCAKKTTGDIGEESKLYGFYLYERDRGRPRTLEGIIKRDLMVHNTSIAW